MPLQSRFRHGRPIAAVAFADRILRTLLRAAGTITALLLLSVATHAYCQQLTEAKIVEMHKAGLSDDLIIQQIKRDGISFQMNADATLELKRSGLSERVLGELLAPSPAEKVTVEKSLTPVDSARNLYERGDYAQVIDFAQDALTKSPANCRMRVMLILGYLRVNELAAAHAQAEELHKFATTPEDQRYLSQIQGLLEHLDAQQAFKMRFIEALNRLSRSDAEAVLRDGIAGDDERQLLTLYLDVFSARFADATKLIDGLLTLPFSQRKQLEAYVQLASRRYAASEAKVNDYLYSPLTPSYCDSDYNYMTTYFGDFSRWSLQDYRAQVMVMASISPLDSKSMDLAFHAQLLATTYTDLQSLGDKILAAKGNIRIPGAASDRFFTFVIDSATKRFYTEVDPHPFSVRYGSHPFSGKKTEENENKFSSELEPVNLRFQDVIEVDQHVGSWDSMSRGMMVKKPFVLKFKPAGLVPDYALMRFLLCTSGEAAELNASGNLGRFVVHATGRSDIRAELANPDKAHKGSSADALLMGLAQVNSSLAFQHGSTTDQAVAQMMSQAVQESVTADQANETRQQQQQLAWYDVLNHQSLNVFSESSFKVVESAMNASP
jgi:hypothetical protein